MCSYPSSARLASWCAPTCVSAGDAAPWSARAEVPRVCDVLCDARLDCASARSGAGTAFQTGTVRGRPTRGARAERDPAARGKQAQGRWEIRTVRARDLVASTCHRDVYKRTAALLTAAQRSPGLTLTSRMFMLCLHAWVGGNPSPTSQIRCTVAVRTGCTLRRF
jgi:hypothetical protein